MVSVLNLYRSRVGLTRHHMLNQKLLIFLLCILLMGERFVIWVTSLFLHFIMAKIKKILNIWYKLQNGSSSEFYDGLCWELILQSCLFLINFVKNILTWEERIAGNMPSRAAVKFDCWSKQDGNILLFITVHCCWMNQ